MPSRLVIHITSKNVFDKLPSSVHNLSPSDNQVTPAGPWRESRNGHERCDGGAGSSRLGRWVELGKGHHEAGGHWHQVSGRSAEEVTALA